MEPLHIHEVHLWCARPETVAAQAAYAAAGALLTADEAKRLARALGLHPRPAHLSRHPRARSPGALAIRARGAERLALRDHGPRAPEVEKGSGPPLRFNLSNTRGLVICGVVGEGEIGVDVEPVRADAPWAWPITTSRPQRSLRFARCLPPRSPHDSSSTGP
jgi:4'-phosphopantetheinyl transferase